MKNVKKVASLALTTALALSSTSAYAAEMGIYIGGTVDKYYDIEAFITNKATALTEVNTAGLENVMYVDQHNKITSLEEILEKGGLTAALRAIQPGDLKATYVNADGGVINPPEGQTNPGELQVISISAISDINVPFGTAVAELGLPSEVEVTLNDEAATKKMANITWNTANYNANLAGEYTLTGNLTAKAEDNYVIGAGKVASVKVIVAEAPIVLSSGIAGFITDGATGVEGAEVIINGKSALTNADGYYTVLNVAPGTYDVTVLASGYGKTEITDVVVKDSKLSTVSSNINSNSLLKANITVSGMVVNKETDEPVVANLTLEYNDPVEGWKEIATDTADHGAANGVFEINQTDAHPDMEFGGEYRLTASYGILDDINGAFHDKVVTFNTKTDAVANLLEGIEMTPVAAMTLSGVALDSDGNAATSNVELYDMEGNLLDTTTPASDGAFSFDDITLPTGKYVVFLDDAGTSANDAVYFAEINVTEGVDLTHNISLIEGFDVNFLVGTEEIGGKFATNGSDADAATFTATLKQGSTVITSDSYVANNTADDDDLSFALTRVAPGNYTVELTGDYLITKSFNVSVVDADVNASGRTSSAGTIKGKVESAPLTGIVGATVELLDASGNIVATATTTAGGNYTFVGLAAGNYTVRASKNGYQALVSNPITVAVDTDSTDNDRNVTLVAVATTGDVAGFVRTAGTLAPAQGAVITYYAVNVQGFEAGDLIDEATVAADGSYAFTGLTPGLYTVIVRDPGNHEIFKATQQVVAGDDIKNANYRLSSGGNATLNIKVVDAEGKALELANTGHLTLIDGYDDPNSATDDSESKFQDLADSDSNKSTFALTDLAAGTYSIAITAPAGYVYTGTTVTVGKGVTQAFVVTLVDAASVHDINFRILNQDGSYANADATVVVFGADGSVLNSDETNASGIATLANMADGTYTYYVFKNGNIVHTGSVTVAGDDVNVPAILLDTYID